MDGLQESTNYLSPEDKQRLALALDMAKEAHKNQKRYSGEPFIIHPIEVTKILASMHLDADALIAGLLHDTVEDTSVTFAQIEDAFGKDVRLIVEGETKISTLKLKNLSREVSQAENLRQMLLAMVNDVRVIIVKLADRLHNMRTLEHMTEAKQKLKARETLEIFAPLATLIGIQHIKNELEDLAFYYLYPEQFSQLESQVYNHRLERQEQVTRSQEMLQDRLTQEGIKARISGRCKHLYSIYLKMQRDKKSLKQIFDLIALRAIVEPRTDDTLNDQEREKAVCYHTLGIVHSLWTPIPGRFKDYIGVPKQNGYQSLHTTIIGLQGQPMEVQIRTSKMHEVAEYGVAAHWAYKEGKTDQEGVAKRFEWFKNHILDFHSLADNSANSFVEIVKNDLFAERVFCFTPKGKIINLPRGSTPIDLAYQIHTEVGHTCIGARVDGALVSLNYKLENGQQVEILTTRNPQYGPSRDWLNVVQTKSAKQKIRHYLRQKEKQVLLEKGKQMLKNSLRRNKLSIVKYTGKELLKQTTKELINTENTDELFLALANERLTAKQIIAAMVPESKEPIKKQTVSRAPTVNGETNVFIESLKIPAKFAKCCSPKLNDEIIGYITRGRGVTVHRSGCANLQKLFDKEPERFLTASWQAPNSKDYPVDFEVIANDRSGLLKDILATLDTINKTALKVNADVKDDRNSAHILFRIDVNSEQEAQHIKEMVSCVPDVREIYYETGS